MHIDAITPYNQNFQKRIKMNKSNLIKIAETAGLGTAATASIAAQADFDSYAMNMLMFGFTGLDPAGLPEDYSLGSAAFEVVYGDYLSSPSTDLESQQSCRGISVAPTLLQPSLISGAVLLNKAQDNIKELNEQNKKIPS